MQLSAEQQPEMMMPGAVIKVGIAQRPPDAWDGCILLWPALCGAGAAALQSHVFALLRDHWAGDGDLVVLTPDPDSNDEYIGELAEWYEWARRVADVIMVWCPPGTSGFPNLPAVAEFAQVVDGVQCDTAEAVQMSSNTERHAIPVATSPDAMVSAAIEAIGSGARRVDGERDVPLAVWRSASFRRWYSAQTSAGNKLLGARLVWTLSTKGLEPTLIYWALHVRMYIRIEDRVKSNEVVISRPDISVVLLYRPAPQLEDTIVVLVREFRSPASTPDGNVHELPGGSGPVELGALAQAVMEVEEELGLAIDARRLRAQGSRQVAANLSAHHAELFAAEISPAELQQLRALASVSHGASDTERTWIEIATFGEICASKLVDWATLGMVAQVLSSSNSSTPID